VVIFAALDLPFFIQRRQVDRTPAA
jgi:hypothetical protein